MTEQKDPMELWVGNWTPEDVIDRETRLLDRPQAPERPREGPVDSETHPN